jgi:nitrite reductase/ring-hydroxylating ferredoxin subunit
MDSISRRHFVAAVGACAACAMTGTALAQPKPRKPAGPTEIGTKADYAKDGIYDKFVKSAGFFVIRNDKRLYACTNVCTHKYAVMQLAEGEIYCPKHGSKFSVEGTPTDGPAKASLARFSIKTAADGKITVDPGKSFEEKEWDDAGAFVTIE